MADISDFLKVHAQTSTYRSLGFRLLDYGDGVARMECPVEPNTQNVNGDLHGGILAMLVDEAGTVALASRDRTGRPGVTTDLNVSYFAPGRPPKVLATARALKIGRTLGFVQVDVTSEAGQLVAQGRMTKFMGR